MSQFFPNFKNPSVPDPNQQDIEIHGELPSETEDVVILGRIHKDKEFVKDDLESRYWFTYRKGFAQIGGNGPSSDQGWGCMLRAGQMMLAETISQIKLSRDYKWKIDSEENETYQEIISYFLDTHSSPVSIQQIALTGSISEKRKVGEWFGPNTMAQVMKKICHDKSLGVSVHVAMDSVVSKAEVKAELERKDSNVPILLIIPLRLGLDQVNTVYINSIRYFLKSKECVGIMGGKPNQAHYFVGLQDTNDTTWLLYLDPHTTQSFNHEEFNKSIHTRQMCWMKANRIDPSLAVGFKFSNYEEFESWTQKIKEESHMPFGIVDETSDRLVSVRSTVISGDSDNSDYEVLDLN